MWWSPKKISHSTADQTRTGQRFQPVYARAIISGRGDEVIELAKTNWLGKKGGISRHNKDMP